MKSKGPRHFDRFSSSSSSHKLLLIIKAETFREVKSAGAAHGIHLSDIAVNSESGFEFRARTDEKNLLTVQRWFNEESEIIPYFGYPTGTLLFFRQKD